MPEYATLVTKAGDQALSVIKRAEEASLNAVSTVTTLVSGFAPQIPQTPLSGRLPSAETVVRSTFGLAERLVEAQKTYTIGALDRVAPALDRVGPALDRVTPALDRVAPIKDAVVRFSPTISVGRFGRTNGTPAPKAAAKPASKPAAKKTTAKKPAAKKA